MPVLYLIGGHIALGLLGYLVVALLKSGVILMTFNGIFQLLLYMVVLLALAKPLGRYMARVYEGQPTCLDRVCGPLERLIYRLCGMRTDRPEAEMGW